MNTISRMFIMKPMVAIHGQTGVPICLILLRDFSNKDSHQWDAYTSENGEVMFLDNECEMQNDQDREARKSLSKNQFL